MENASKALLIAGSVLIAILLIAVGVRIFNSTQGTTDAAEGTMQTTEVAMFNNQFLPYIGEKKTARDAISLLNVIIANNSTNNRKVTVQLTKSAGNPYDGKWAAKSGTDATTLGEFIKILSSYNSNERIFIEVSNKSWGVTGYNDERLHCKYSNL